VGDVACLFAVRPGDTIRLRVLRDGAPATVSLRIGDGSTFVEEYDVTRLVRLGRFDRTEDAIRPEKQLEARNRDGKLELPIRE
jgi:hypothetical protein